MKLFYLFVLGTLLLPLTGCKEKTVEITGQAETVSLPTTAGVNSKEQIEDHTWKAAEAANVLDTYEAYLSVFPNGKYADQVRIKIAAIKTQTVAANKLEVTVKPANVAPQASRPVVVQSEIAFLDPKMVRIPGKNYEIGEFEVTQGEWKAVMGNNPSAFSSCGDSCPVEKVSWNDAKKFIRKLNAKTGKQYRLPTANEWSYACDGGGQSEYCGGNNIDSVAWYESNSGKTTHPVGQKQANGYGLYDMSGNVWEWMNDCYEENCAERVLLGSSWDTNRIFARSPSRFNFDPAIRLNYNGFRVARTLQ